MRRTGAAGRLRRRSIPLITMLRDAEKCMPLTFALFLVGVTVSGLVIYQATSVVNSSSDALDDYGTFFPGY